MDNYKNCRFCNSDNIKLRDVVYSNGSKHVKLSCFECGRHYTVQQGNPLQDNDICFLPKHKGKTWIDVAREDMKYLEWCSENLEKESLRNKIADYVGKIYSYEKI
jgi:transposase-like protein